MTESSPLLAGCLLSGGLIVAIGPQNLHLMQVGLQRQHVGVTVATCVLVDALLLTLGLSGLSLVLATDPMLLKLFKGLALPVLLLMAVRSLREAVRSGSAVAPSPSSIPAARTALGSAALISLGNPAVWIETLLIVGVAGAGLSAGGRLQFGLGALLASLLWFGALGYGARYLSRWLQGRLLHRGLHTLSALLLLSCAAGSL